MKKRNMKLKKYRSTENEVEKHNIWYTGKVMEMGMTNVIRQVCGQTLARVRVRTEIGQ